MAATDAGVWSFPGFTVDTGFATILVAIIPVLVAVLGFWLRNRFVRQRLTAALLEEVRIKLQNLLASDSWLAKAEDMVISGLTPHIVTESHMDIIFDNHHQQLTLLPSIILNRITRFYKLDDFINRAMEECRSSGFQAAGRQRRLQHFQNIRMLLLPNAILAGIRAELALGLACGLTPLGELAFKRRHSSRWRSHRIPLARARKIASRRLKNFRSLPYAACVWPKSPHLFGVQRQ